MVERRVVKGCCGRTAILMVSAKPIEKGHVALFKQSGYVVPDNYAKAGLFYAKKGTMIATATFGIKNINVRCSGAGCKTLIDEFENILKQIEAT
jgi:hypothetical protein